MKKHWILYTSVGVALYLVFLVVYVPADWLAWGVSHGTKGVVRIDNPTGSIWGAWAVSIDGDDQVWISNFAPGGGITRLCGARPETCPPGMKTGDPISPPGG